MATYFFLEKAVRLRTEGYVQIVEVHEADPDLIANFQCEANSADDAIQEYLDSHPDGLPHAQRFEVFDEAQRNFSAELDLLIAQNSKED
jgi:hypothetical protein